ncbi:MAG: hypothetical protein Q9P90_06460 [candidate division KSB1 bacterium]|nr:hypothetical protein [candidate division KSB1 bacterium]
MIRTQCLFGGIKGHPLLSVRPVCDSPMRLAGRQGKSANDSLKMLESGLFLVAILYDFMYILKIVNCHIDACSRAGSFASEPEEK